MKAGHPVPEEPYEISHDIHGAFDGPRNGRIRAMQKVPLFLQLARRASIEDSSVLIF